MSTCKSCGAPIEFVDTKRLTVVTDQGDTITGRESHFATCPHADRHRAPRESQLEL